MAQGHGTDDHGHSIAGWVGVATIIAGSVLIGVGVGFGITVLWIIGWIVVALGALAGLALSRAGFGHTRIEKPMDHDEWLAAQQQQGR